jgi:hypothetical protein
LRFFVHEKLAALSGILVAWRQKGISMFQLTKDQHEAIANNDADNARVIDPVSNIEYVLVRADVYARLSGMIDVDFHVSDTYAAVDVALADLWSDPKMDEYDRFEEFKK